MGIQSGVKSEWRGVGRRVCVAGLVGAAGLMMTRSAWGQETPPATPQAVTAPTPPPSLTPSVPPPAAPEPVRPGEPMPAASPMNPLLNVSFEGGTIEQYIATLRDATHSPVNVTVPAEAAGEEIPAIHLKSVSTRQALDALTYIFPMQSGIRINVQEDRADGGWPTFFLVYSVSPQQPKAFGPNGAVPMVGDKATEIFALRDLTAPAGAGGGASMPLDQVLGAIETAVKLDGQPAEMTFHKDTGVLILRGVPVQVATARAMVTKLREQLEMTRQAQAKKADDELAMAQAKREQSQKMLEAQADMARRELQLRQAQENFERQKKLADSGTLSADKLAAVHDVYQKEQIEYDMARARMDRLKADQADPTDELARERVAAWRRGQQGDRDELLSQIRQLQDTVRALQEQIRSMQSAQEGMGGTPAGR